MDNNKIIIIVLIAIIAALLVGIFAMMPNISKQDTKLSFESNSTLTEGDSLEIKLIDVNGTAIAGQTVNIAITDENNTSDYHSVVTDGNGTGNLKLEKVSGEYTVTINYGGNDNYTACNASQKLTIKEKEQVAEVQTSSSTSSSSASSSTQNSRNTVSYDSELNVFYDSNGIVVDADGHHPQGVGSNYQELVEWAESGRGME